VSLHYTHTHTHPFNSPFSGSTQVSRYQKTNLDFTGARDSEWQCISWAICKSAPCTRQITTPVPHHSVFYRPDALPAAQPTSSKHYTTLWNIYSGTVCNKHVHSTMTRSSRFHCPVGVINKPTTVKFWISPLYRRLAVAKFSKYTM